jgi:hypothetical protein
MKVKMSPMLSFYSELHDALDNREHRLLRVKDEPDQEQCESASGKILPQGAQILALEADDEHGFSGVADLDGKLYFVVMFVETYDLLEFIDEGEFREYDHTTEDEDARKELAQAMKDAYINKGDSK